MKKLVFLLLLSVYCLNGNAQEHVLDYEGDLYFIPASMTKYGQPFLYSRKSEKLTIYDGDLNVIKSYTDPMAGTDYEIRVVEYTCIADPDSKELLTEWAVSDDRIIKEKVSSGFEGFEVYSDDNSYHSRGVYLSQTFFDDDEDFEFIQSDKTVIPITVRTQDYYAEHKENSTEDDSEMASVYEEDAWWRDYGADGYSTEWNQEREKMVFRLHKTEEYGGLFYSNLKIKSIDGVVKQTLKGINSISYAYNYRGNCYINSSRKLYRIGAKKDKSSLTRRGDVDDNGVVNVADHVKLSEIILNQNE